MNRRVFITALLGSTAAAVVLPRVELFASTLPAPSEEVIREFTLSEIHREAWRILREKMDFAGFSIHDEHIHPLPMLGQSVPTGETLTHQYGVSVNPLNPSFSVEPAMASLAERLAFSGVDRYGELRTDLPGALYSANEGALRLIGQFSLHDGCDIYRFAVIGGASKAGLSRAAKRLIEFRKTRIRRTLARPHRVLPLPA